MKHLDLFSGIGGFALAAYWADINTIAFCEKDKFCRQILRKNWPDVYIFDDIEAFHWSGEIDILTAGFPCQPFSSAGRKKGINDDRYLWPEVIRLIRECNPNWIILENVCGIVHMALDNIIDDLEKENYESQSFILPACAANAPHRRDRVWIIANTNSIRSKDRVYNREDGYLQENKNWNMEKIQQKWAQLIPDTWSTHSAYDWLQYNRKASRGDDGLSYRLDRIKSLGNAVVPQIPFVFMSYIKLLSE